MAGASRPPAGALSGTADATSGIAAAVATGQARLGFFEAVALLARADPPVPLRFRADASLAFPPHEIAAVGWEGERFALTVPFLGLYGPASPLPAFYTERLLQDDAAARNLRDFLDIFNHAALVLLIELKARSRAFLEQPAPGATPRLLRHLLRLGGLPALSEAPAAPAGPEVAGLLALTGLLAFRRGTAGEVERALGGLLGRRVTVAEWVARAAPLPEAQLARMGRGPAALGRAVIGRGGVDPGGAIRVVLHGLSGEEQAGLLPGGEGHARLARLLRLLLPAGIETEIELRSEAPIPFRLGRGGPQIGIAARLGGAAPGTARYRLALP